MKNQKGFSVVLLIVAIVVLFGIAESGLLVYKNHHAKSSTPEPASNNYHFSPVTIDTSKWVEDEMFQGFTYKHPANWKVQSGKGFQQVLDGFIGNTGKPTYKTMITLYLYSPDFTYQGVANTDETDGMPTGGARIRITATVRKSGDSGANCSNLVLGYDPTKGCVSTDYWGADFTKSTDKMNYGTRLDFAASNKSAYYKNYYISVAQQIVNSYKLY